MESQPQNPEFRTNPFNFQTCSQQGKAPSQLQRLARILHHHHAGFQVPINKKIGQK